jgi:hypothetical protein
VAFGCRNAIFAPPAPIRGFSSIRRTPFSFNFYIIPLSPDAEDGDIYWDGQIDYSLTSDGSLGPFGANRFNYNPFMHYFRPSERWTAGGFFDYKVNEKLNAYMEVQYLNNRDHSQMAPYCLDLKATALKNANDS